MPLSGFIFFQEVIPLRDEDIRRSSHFTHLLKDVDAAASGVVGGPSSTLLLDDALDLSEAKLATMKARMMEKKVPGDVMSAVLYFRLPYTIPLDVASNGACLFKQLVVMMV